jgi:hypothetical protein
VSIRNASASNAIAAMPSNHQWFPVAETASTVNTRCNANTQRHLLVLAEMIPSETIAAHPT